MKTKKELSKEVKALQQGCKLLNGYIKYLQGKLNIGRRPKDNPTEGNGETFLDKFLKEKRKAFEALPRRVV